MIDIQKARTTFSAFVNTYDTTHTKVFLKHKHSMRVADLSREIAHSLNLSAEEVEVAELIGLLHDYGRFEQITKYNTFNDAISMDHGLYGCYLLFDEGQIRNFVETPKYDQVIKAAIFNHNKSEIEECDAYTKMFCQIIRDADKLDILYLLSTGVIGSQEYKEEASYKVVQSLKNRTYINASDVKNPVDQLLLHFGLIYDLNFKYSYELLERKKYIDESINRFIGVSILQELKHDINDYIESRGEV